MTIKEFLHYTGDFYLYLAQFPLYQTLLPSNTLNFNQKIAQKINKKNLQKLFKIGLKIPFITQLKNLDSINLWYSKKSTLSQLHFDEYDNILF